MSESTGHTFRSNGRHTLPNLDTALDQELACLLDEGEARAFPLPDQAPFCNRLTEETEGTKGTECPSEGVSEPVLLSSASSALFCQPSTKLTEEEFFAKVCDIACSSPLPTVAARFYLPALKTLVAVCAAAQSLTGDLPFLLTCRRAGALLGVSHTRAYQLLMVLVAANVLEIVKHGDSRNANRYRYLAD